MGRLLSTDLLFPLKVSARVGDQERSIRHPLERRRFLSRGCSSSFFYFYVYSRVSRVFLSNVARRRSFRKRWLFIVVSFVLRLFLFIVRFFSFFTSSRCPTVHRRLTQRPGEYRKSLPASFFRP